MKIISKKLIKMLKKEEYIKNERLIFEFSNPNIFFTKLHFAFQDFQNLFLVLEFIQGGKNSIKFLKTILIFLVLLKFSYKF